MAVGPTVKEKLEAINAELSMSLGRLTQLLEEARRELEAQGPDATTAQRKSLSGMVAELERKFNEIKAIGLPPDGVGK